MHDAVTVQYLDMPGTVMQSTILDTYSMMTN